MRCGDPDHLKILKKGVETWHKWRDRNEKIHPDREGISFAPLNLTDADLSGTNLQNEDLEFCNLRKAN